MWNEDDQVHWVHRTVGEVDNGSSFSERWNQDSVLLSEPASGKETSRQEGGSHATNGNSSLLLQARLETLRNSMTPAGSNRRAPAMTVPASGTGTMKVIKSCPPAV